MDIDPELDAARIANGHAWRLHRNEFSGISSVNKFAEHIEDILNNASEVKPLARGRTAFWDQLSGTLVIHDANSPDMGTAFKPSRGKAYYDNLQ